MGGSRERDRATKAGMGGWDHKANGLSKLFEEAREERKGVNWKKERERDQGGKGIGASKTKRRREIRDQGSVIEACLQKRRMVKFLYMQPNTWKVMRQRRQKKREARKGHTKVKRQLRNN